MGDTSPSDAESESPAAVETTAPVDEADATETREISLPAPAHHAPANDSGGSTVIAVLGMMLLVLSGLVVGLIAYVNSDEGPTYGVRMDSEDYDLDSMAVRVADIPSGLVLSDRLTFTNEEWAYALDNVDPEARLPQLEAQKRVRGTLSLFEWEDGFTQHLAETLALLSQSTIYESEDAASEAIAGSALCGLRLNDTAPIDEFNVPKIGDEAVGFFVISNDEQVGTSIDTVVCFRTGRIVHGVVQSAFEGAQDIGFVIDLARDMQRYTADTFEGTVIPADEDPDPET
jgi:hypothetical protein